MSEDQSVFWVPAEEAGARLDEFLARRYGVLSRIKLRQAIDSGGCLVNARPAAPGERLAQGDEVRASIDQSIPNAMQPEEIPVEVLFDDAWLAVVNKPAGMLVHPTRGVKSGTLANALAWRWNRDAEPAAAVRPVFVNRLDKPTSGLMLVAKRADAGAWLARSGELRKQYTALVGGLIEGRHSMEAPVARVSETRPHWRVSSTGKPARSELVAVESRHSRTLVTLVPVTGRTNQLRIHCAHIGHPIVGDQEYGGPEAGRLCLHASALAFVHPETRERLAFESPLPDGIAEIWERE